MRPCRIGVGYSWKMMTFFAFVAFNFWHLLVKIRAALQALQVPRQTQVFPDHLHQDLQGADRTHLPGDDGDPGDLVLHLL